MQDRHEQLAERLRKAEQARDLLKDLERRLKDGAGDEGGPELERPLAELDRLAGSLPEPDRIRWFIESAAGATRARDRRRAGTDVSRSRSAVEGEVSTLRGTLKRGAS